MLNLFKYNNNIPTVMDLFRDAEEISIPIQEFSIVPKQEVFACEVVDCVPDKITNIIDLIPAEEHTYKGEKIDFHPACYEYQKDGISFMCSRIRSILADDMGLGKTLQILEVCRIKKCKRVLILCPKSVLNVWRNEIHKWYTKGVTVINGDYNTRFLTLLNSEAEFTISTYETFRQMESEFEMVEMSRKPFDMIVCDESHKIKNRDSKITKLIIHKAIEDKSVPMILATATPVMNRHEEIFPFLKIVWPHFFTNYQEFLRDNFVCKLEYRRSKDGTMTEHVKKAIRLRNPSEFQSMLSAFMIRRLRDDVLDLPATIINRVAVQLDGDQKNAYVSMQTNFFAEFGDMEENEFEIGAPNIISQIIRLKQIAVSEKLLINVDDMEGSAKLDKLIDIIENTEGKIVVFSQFREAILRLSKHLNAEHIPNVMFHGAMTESQRLNNIALFKNNPDMKVLLGTTKSMGFGIDGLQEVCCDCVFMDMEWTPAAVNQAIGRLARNGQTHKVMVTIIEAENTIEQWINEKLKIKDGIIEEMIPITRIKDFIKQNRGL